MKGLLSMRVVVWWCVLMTLALGGCTLLRPDGPEMPPTPDASAASSVEVRWTFTVVRHAERADDGTDNPPLTDAGVARAARLAARLADARGVAVYASPYQRAQQTAQPTADVWGVPLTTYDPTQSASDLTRAAKNAHSAGAVLIVGHSDTVADIVADLCRCPVEPIAESEFGNLYTVQIGTNDEVVNVVQSLDY
jgi:broad specificity phosphatase PhoE